MEPKIEEVASRIRSLREDLDISMQEMAQATGRSLSEYAAQESGEQDLSFTFLSKCAKRFGVDVVELLLRPADLPARAGELSAAVLYLGEASRVSAQRG